MKIPLTKKPLPRKFGRKNANALLRVCGMTSAHPDYKYFQQILTAICEKATQRTLIQRSFGEFLENLVSGDVVTPQAVESIRELARDMQEYDVSPDFNAIRGITVAIEQRVARYRSNSNLRASASVSDEDIQQALALPTRSAQAQRLGITERQLLRRLKAMKTKG